MFQHERSSIFTLFVMMFVAGTSPGTTIMPPSFSEPVLEGNTLFTIAHASRELISYDLTAGHINWRRQYGERVTTLGSGAPGELLLLHPSSTVSVVNMKTGHNITVLTNLPGIVIGTASDRSVYYIDKSDGGSGHAIIGCYSYAKQGVVWQRVLTNNNTSHRGAVGSNYIAVLCVPGTTSSSDNPESLRLNGDYRLLLIQRLTGTISGNIELSPKRDGMLWGIAIEESRTHVLCRTGKRDFCFDLRTGTPVPFSVSFFEPDSAYRKRIALSPWSRSDSYPPSNSNEGRALETLHATSYQLTVRDDFLYVCGGTHGNPSKRLLGRVRLGSDKLELLLEETNPVWTNQPAITQTHEPGFEVTIEEGRSGSKKDQ